MNKKEKRVAVILVAVLLFLGLEYWYFSHRDSTPSPPPVDRWEVEKQRGFDEGVRDYNSGVYTTPQQRSAQEYLRQKSRDDFDQAAKGMMTSEQYRNYKEQRDRQR